MATSGWLLWKRAAIISTLLCKLLGQTPNSRRFGQTQAREPNVRDFQRTGFEESGCLAESDITVAKKSRSYGRVSLIMLLVSSVFLFDMLAFSSVSNKPLMFVHAGRITDVNSGPSSPTLAILF